MELPSLESGRDRLPLQEIGVTVAGRTWYLAAVMDQDALIESVQTEEDLANFPYGLMLWPSAIGLGEWLTEHASDLWGKRVLELGCGVGLGGLIARACGDAAQVIQTDYQADALAVARHNAARNGLEGLEQRLGDWRAFPDWGTFDLVIGADILYERGLHEMLRSLLPRLLSPQGLLVLADPLRPQALEFVERMERSGQWHITMEGRRVLHDGHRKDIALFLARLTRPL